MGIAGKVEVCLHLNLFYNDIQGSFSGRLF